MTGTPPIKNNILHLRENEECILALNEPEYDNLQVRLAAGACLTLLVAHTCDHELHHRFDLASNSQCKLFYLNAVKNFANQKIKINFAENSANCEIFGFSAVAEAQKLNTQVQVLHNAKNCTSKQFFKAIAGDEAQAVFDGKIEVASVAQKTEALQTYKGILLNSAARITAQPQLEIYADDVKCSHGVAIGQFNEEALFYLCSRGIGEVQAQKMLLQGFAQEVLEQIPESLQSEIPKFNIFQS